MRRSIIVNIILLALLALLADAQGAGGAPALGGRDVGVDADPDFAFLGVRAVVVTAEFVLAPEAVGVRGAEGAVQFGVVGAGVGRFFDGLFGLGGRGGGESLAVVVAVVGVEGGLLGAAGNALGDDGALAVFDVFAAALVGFLLRRRGALVRERALHVVPLSLAVNGVPAAAVPHARTSNNRRDVTKGKRLLPTHTVSVLRAAERRRRRRFSVLLTIAATRSVVQSAAAGRLLGTCNRRG